MKVWSLIGKSRGFCSYEFDVSSGQYVKRCFTCMVPFDRTKYTIIPPVKITMRYGNMELGDFSYESGMPYPIVRERVKDYFEAREIPCEFYPVEILKPSKKFAQEKLYLLRCTKAIPIDEKLSTLRYLDCPECKRHVLLFPDERDGDNVVISAHGEKLTVFVWEPFMAETTFITDDFVQELKAQGFTHLDDLFDGGEIVE